MDLMIFLQALIAIVIAFLLGLFMVQFTFKLFSKVVKSIDETKQLKENNIAVAILNGSFILSMAILIKNTIIPMTQTLFNSIFYAKLGFTMFLKNMGLIVAQFFSALFLGVLLLYAGVWFFSKLNKSIDEFVEINNNNIAVSIIVGVICISMAIIMQDALAQFIELLIPSASIQNGSLTPFG